MDTKEQKNITEIETTELKALAYDRIAMSEKIHAELQAINSELARRNLPEEGAVESPYAESEAEKDSETAEA